jgi:hypothetical protein
LVGEGAFPVVDVGHDGKVANEARIHVRSVDR